MRQVTVLQACDAAQVANQLAIDVQRAFGRPCLGVELDDRAADVGTAAPLLGADLAGHSGQRVAGAAQQAGQQTPTGVPRGAYSGTTDVGKLPIMMISP